MNLLKQWAGSLLKLSLFSALVVFIFSALMPLFFDIRVDKISFFATIAAFILIVLVQHIHLTQKILLDEFTPYNWLKKTEILTSLQYLIISIVLFGGTVCSLYFIIISAIPEGIYLRVEDYDISYLLFIGVLIVTIFVVFNFLLFKYFFTFTKMHRENKFVSFLEINKQFQNKNLSLFFISLGLLLICSLVTISTGYITNALGLFGGFLDLLLGFFAFSLFFSIPAHVINQECFVEDN